MMPVVQQHDDRSTLQRWMQSMSDQVKGQAADIAPDMTALGADSAPVDEPDAPGEFDDETAEPAQAEPAGASKSSYAWGGFENGRIDRKMLKSIGQGAHKLEASAADSWIAMRDAAKAAGVNLTLTDSYRDFDAQVATRRNKGHMVATAKPGTSVHGWGKAVDVNVNDPKVLAWLKANGGKFGWVNPAWAQKKGKSMEPWHWEHA